MALAPSTGIRLFGVPAYGMVTCDGRRVLLDPILDENPGSP